MLATRPMVMIIQLSVSKNRHDLDRNHADGTGTTVLPPPHPPAAGAAGFYDHTTEHQLFDNNDNRHSIVVVTITGLP